MQFNQIGEGLQGAVFEQVGHLLALKKEKPGNEFLPSNLKHEFTVHKAVYNAFELFGHIVGSDICIPRPDSFISKPKNQKLWDHLSSFPSVYRQPGDVIWMERIHPVPEEVREALVAQFYPKGDSSETFQRVLETPSNKHALLRTYFGKRATSLTTATFSLRNFPLCLEPMESLGMNMEKLAKSMGQAYAIMHWGAGVDGDDVEFVLGTWPVHTAAEYKAMNLQPECRAMRYFLLDFGQCQTVDLSQDDFVVYQAFKGAMVTGDNQLFIPHYSRSTGLFEVFKQAYMEAGHKVLIEKGLEGKFSMDEFMKEYLEYAEDFL